MSREEYFVASVGGVGPGEDGADACLTVKVETMPVGEAVEHRTPVARSVILDADGADTDALAAEAERAGRLLQGRFVETLMRTFELVGASESFEAEEAPEPGAQA